VTRKLEDLRSQTLEYEDALSRVLTIRANRERLEAEEDGAHRIGDRLIAELDGITHGTDATLGERTRAAHAEIDRTKTLLFVVLAITPFFAMGLAVILIRGFTRPIGTLVSATRRLKAGDLGHRIEGLRDEYGEVAASFNEMARALEEGWRKMQWTEQIVVLGELAGGLAHEINNPLAGIKTSMELLASDPSITGEPKEIVLEVVRQIQRIERLVKRILNFAKPPKPQFLAVDVNEIVDETVSLARRHPAFQRRDDGRIEVAKDLARGLPTVLADPLHLHQVFLNLLLNAADAMPEGGTITARTRRDAATGSVRVTIADTGTGVDPSVIGKIFLPFFTTKTKGTGLGLATSKRLVEQHGGRIAVENLPGGGASFSVVLPVEPFGVGPASDSTR
jgi:signal transduction histidine kinase